MASGSGNRSHALRPDSRTRRTLSRAQKLRLTITHDEPDEDGWIVARVHGVPGALSQGPTRDEARENVIDALQLMLAPEVVDERVAGSEPLDLRLRS
jgi:predicted RNase H-like HicB family nuclease